MATPVQMPKQGNTVEECLIVDWAVSEGSDVNEGDVLCSIETDKATFEVEAPAAGKVLKLFYSGGDLVPVLTNIAVIGNDGEDVSEFAPDGDSSPEPAAEAPAKNEEKKTEPAPAKAETPVSKPAAQPTIQQTGDIKISPRARSASDKLGVDPRMVQGSGPDGRIISSDIEQAAASGLRMTPAAKAGAAASGLVAGSGTGIGGRVLRRDLVEAGTGAMMIQEEPPTEVPYKGIRKLIGDRMLASLHDHAQLTLNASADATAIMKFRKNIKAVAESAGLPNITFNDMVSAVVAWTLPKFPELNALFDKSSGKVVQYKQVNLAMAVDTERGLMVPVINNAHVMALSEISRNIADLAAQCRKGSIDPDLLSGGTFTITNLGALGIESFTPVLNSPQVAILGICSIEQKPVPDAEKGFRFQPTMGLSLTIDHQVVDGAPAAKFLKAVADGISNFDFTLAMQAI